MSAIGLAEFVPDKLTSTSWSVGPVRGRTPQRADDQGADDQGADDQRADDQKAVDEVDEVVVRGHRAQELGTEGAHDPHRRVAARAVPQDVP
ncbi:hypothetical protein [Streptomyces poonensis]|uniref:Uncharacterized protein n=1 Tax=Streptomyces poonensis TaxID=68255 RepID=A0A918PC30_9ACTN|nr:hypothetical protein [Streptomyces poonensis]GGY98168.1 hypothetical protein GCM10010365_15910 [Streptomyces poonensis]